MTVSPPTTLRFQPRLVLFDLDGTLIDSAPDIAEAVNELLHRHGHAPHSLAAVRTMIGHGTEALVARAFAARGEKLDAHDLALRHTEMMQVFPRHLTNLTTLRVGARKAVLAIQGSGISTGVVTNKPEKFSRTILEHFDLAARLDLVIGGDSGFAKKPAPDMLLAACHMTRQDVENTVLIGDSTADIAAAKSAGIACILVRGGYCTEPLDSLGADMVIDDLEGLDVVLAGSGEHA